MIYWGGHILQANFLEDFTFTGLHLESRLKTLFVVLCQAFPILFNQMLHNAVVWGQWHELIDG